MCVCVEHLWHVLLCVIDWSDEDFRVRDKCVSVGFQQEGNRGICRSNTHYFKIQTYRGVVIGRLLLSEDEWMHPDPS